MKSITAMNILLKNDMLKVNIRGYKDGENSNQTYFLCIPLANSPTYLAKCYTGKNCNAYSGSHLSNIYEPPLQSTGAIFRI